jgi:hypothetical protein
MNYQKIYNQIIKRAVTENRKKGSGVYYELHHIIPKCMGGNNDKDNLVLLTAREHFIVHKLLCEIYPNEDKLVYAYWRLCNGKNKSIVSSHDYDYAKLLMANANTRRQHTVISKNKISKIHKGKITSDETKRKISESKKGKITTEETRNKISIALSGKPRSKETKDKISKANKGKPKSQELKDKISKANKGKPAWNKGIPHSLETKLKISQAKTKK